MLCVVILFFSWNNSAGWPRQILGSRLIWILNGNIFLSLREACGCHEFQRMSWHFSKTDERRIRFVTFLHHFFRVSIFTPYPVCSKIVHWRFVFFLSTGLLTSTTVYIENLKTVPLPAKNRNTFTWQKQTGFNLNHLKLRRVRMIVHNSAICWQSDIKSHQSGLCRRETRNNGFDLQIIQRRSTGIAWTIVDHRWNSLLKSYFQTVWPVSWSESQELQEARDQSTVK